MDARAGNIGVGITAGGKRVCLSACVRACVRVVFFISERRMAFTRDRDLYKTKLCTLYLQRGSCPRQSCSFAHGGAELRRMPGEAAAHHLVRVFIVNV